MLFKKIKQMGIILTIVSKNSYENVSQVFNDTRLFLRVISQNKL